MANYGTILGGDEYFDEERIYNDIWGPETDPIKLKALKQASKAIDNLRYIADKADSAQDLTFPIGNQTVVPVAIEQATYLIAEQLLDGWDANIEAENLHLKERRFAQAKSTYIDQSILAWIQAGIPSSEAWRLLYPYLAPVGSIELNRVN